jgi:UDP-N-acetyl-alpha-D-quinovosamine dehydrogenase
MKILVTGATGFIGNKLCQALSMRGDTVVAVARKQVNIDNNITVINKVLSKETDWQDYLKDIDVVIHLAGRAHVMKDVSENPYQAYADINIHATKQLAEQAALSGVKRFIFLSSVKVNGERTDKIAFNETASPHPEDDYGRTKYEAEKALNKISKVTKMEVVIIRPPLVYGEGVKANFKSLIKLVQLNIPLPFGAIDNKRSLVFVENLIDFIILCTYHANAANQNFLISDDEDVSTTQLIQSIKAVSRKKVLLISIPKNWLTFTLRLIGKSSLSDRLCGNLQVDITKAKTLLNWKPPYSFKQGIAKTVCTGE